MQDALLTPFLELLSVPKDDFEGSDEVAVGPVRRVRLVLLVPQVVPRRVAEHLMEAIWFYLASPLSLTHITCLAINKLVRFRIAYSPLQL